MTLAARAAPLLRRWRRGWQWCAACCPAKRVVEERRRTGAAGRRWGMAIGERRPERAGNMAMKKGAFVGCGSRVRREGGEEMGVGAVRGEFGLVES